MGLSWQQGPLAPGAIGRFLVPDPLPGRLLYAEPLRRRMRVRFGGAWVADSEDVVLLHEPGRYPVAYFPLADVFPDVLQASDYRTEHRDLGPTAWYTVSAGAHRRPRAAWQHTGLPDYAGDLKDRVAFAWRAMDSFYEEDDRIVGHAADMYHRIDIRQSSRHLTVRSGDRVVADTARPLALELAPIRVNAISPGVIDTGAWDALGEQGKADYFAQMRARNPARRIGTTDDIANGVLFAMTSTFLTGQTLHIDGGEPLT